MYDTPDRRPRDPDEVYGWSRSHGSEIIAASEWDGPCIRCTACGRVDHADGLHEWDRVALLVTAQATEIMALRRQVLALTDELIDVREERDRMRSALARWHIDQHNRPASAGPG